MKGKILIIEDDMEIASVIKEHLIRENYYVNWASTGLEGLKDFNDNNYDIVLLDIMLPEMDGFNVCKNIRLISDKPIIMLSAKKEVVDKVTGLKIGADDYVTKPFSLIELEARIEINIRRYRKSSESVLKSSNVRRFKGGLEIIDEEMKVLLDKQNIELTGKEYSLLLLMASNINRVFSKSELYESVWNEGDIEGNNTVTVHIKEIRQKLKDNPKNPKYIQTVWGTGYKFIGELEI